MNRITSKRITQRHTGVLRAGGIRWAVATGVLLCISSCVGKYEMGDAGGEGQGLRRALFGAEFRNEDVRSIDFVRIDHPMLGGVLGEITLTEDQQQAFLADMERVEKKGIYKCAAGYVVRISLPSDTLRLKICGGMIANRQNDVYYVLPDGTNPVEKYWKGTDER